MISAILAVMWDLTDLVIRIVGIVTIIRWAFRMPIHKSVYQGRIK